MTAKWAFDWKGFQRGFSGVLRIFLLFFFFLKNRGTSYDGDCSQDFLTVKKTDRGAGWMGCVCGRGLSLSGGNRKRKEVGRQFSVGGFLFSLSNFIFFF